MSTKHLFLTLLAAFSLAFACQKPEANLSYPSIEISLSEASVAEPASSFTVQVISNRAWRVTSDVPWIAVDPDSGSGSMTDTPVTVTVMENTSFTRSGHVVFDIVYDNATLTIAQAGNGSPEDYIIFFNDFDKETATQSYGTSGTSWPYLDQFDGWKHESGVGIANMTYDFSNVSARANSMSNGTYSDYAGSGANNLLFGANGHIAVKNLDLKNFKNFHLSFGTEKYDNNDKTALFDPAEMPVYVSADGAKWIPLSYSYLGTAAGRWNVAEAYFSVPDDVTTLSIYVMATMASAYRLDDLKLDVPEEGSGPVLDFSNGTDLPSGGGGGGGGSDYENAPAKTVQEFIAAADKNTYYKLTGTVSKFNSNYCSFDLTDDSGSIYVYSVDNKDAWSSKIKNGGTVTLAGKYLYYEKNSQHEVVNAYILSFTDGGGDTPSGGGTPKGTGTLDDPYNPAGAANAVKNLTWTSNTEYQKTEPVYVKGKIAKIANNGTFGQSGTYGNASFYISEDGTGDGEFYIFRTMYFNGEKYTSGTDIKVGDEVVIYGPLMNYQGKTPETVANECRLYSLNGATSGEGGGGGDTPGGDGTPKGTGTLADPYNPLGAANAVKNLTWTSNTEYQKTDPVYVKGKIAKIANNGTFGQSGTYGNASFYISEDGTGDGEFYIFRTMYFNGEKYTSGTDIKVGDEVVIYGPLMNYQGKTPETVANECRLYSLNGATSGEGGGGGDTPGGGGSSDDGTSITWTVGSGNQNWGTATSSDYGSGYSATAGGMTVAYYKASSTTNPVAPSADHIRVYKNSHLSISVAGKRITGVEFSCLKAGTSTYCYDMTVAGGSNAVADKDALKVTWTGDVASFEADAPNGQLRISQIKVTYK